jgi:Ca2+-binding EF-hand superfamily protein
MKSMILRPRRCVSWLFVTFALLSLALAGTSALAQQDRDRPNGDRPGRGMGRDRGPGGGRGDRRRDRENGNPPREQDARPADSTTPAPAASTANSFGTTSESDRIRKYASDIVAKYDKDGNSILAGDELDGLSSHLRNADSSGDGKITVDEIYQFASKGSSSASSAKPATSTTTATASKSSDPVERKITNDKRKSYRFKSTKDRTNNWRFSSRDANGDGQVSMSEFASSWSDRTAAEFIRYDKNNDGMITADEAK